MISWPSREVYQGRQRTALAAADPARLMICHRAREGRDQRPAAANHQGCLARALP